MPVITTSNGGSLEFETIIDQIPSGLPTNEELKAACNAKKASLTVSQEECERKKAL